MSARMISIKQNQHQLLESGAGDHSGKIPAPNPPLLSSPFAGGRPGGGGAG
jgi:hypothetical protein